VARTAKVYLVGAGPGDPDLLTRKALRVLEQADVIIYDRLAGPEILALANPEATLIYAGKRQGQQDEIQAEIFDWILRLGDSARSIVRLKSGDPMVFGRGGEELEFLVRHGFETEVVPGLSSALAAPALAGIPVTYRGIAASFSVIAGHRQSLTALDWSIYKGVDTLVVLMGVEYRDIIASALIAQGRPASHPVAFIEQASTDRERVVESTLGEVAGRKVEVEAPAVFVIGEVVRIRTRAAAARAEASPFCASCAEAQRPRSAAPNESRSSGEVPRGASPFCASCAEAQRPRSAAPNESRSSADVPRGARELARFGFCASCSEEVCR
jgi:uroporphyrin-III C-methyltransferase